MAQQWNTLLGASAHIHLLRTSLSACFSRNDQWRKGWFEASPSWQGTWFVTLMPKVASWPTSPSLTPKVSAGTWLQMPAQHHTFGIITGGGCFLTWRKLGIWENTDIFLNMFLFRLCLHGIHCIVGIRTTACSSACVYEISAHNLVWLQEHCFVPAEEDVIIFQFYCQLGIFVAADKSESSPAAAVQLCSCDACTLQHPYLTLAVVQNAGAVPQWLYQLWSGN